MSNSVAHTSENPRTIACATQRHVTNEGSTPWAERLATAGPLTSAAAGGVLPAPGWASPSVAPWQPRLFRRARLPLTTLLDRSPTLTPSRYCYRRSTLPRLPQPPLLVTSLSVAPWQLLPFPQRPSTNSSNGCW